MLRFSCLVAVVACLSGVDAQGVCGQPTHTIVTQEDADAISSCINASTIVINSPTLTQLNLTNIQRVDNLRIESCPVLTSMSAPSLFEINENFTISNLPFLSNLSIPDLSVVIDSLSWTNVPNLVLPSVKTSTDVDGNVGLNIYGDLTISSTGIQQLDFLNFGPAFSRSGTIIITNNTALTLINLKTLRDVDSVTITNSGLDLNVMLPALTHSASLLFSAVAGVSLPVLETVDGDLALLGNTFEGFEVPVLMEIGGDVYLKDNAMLKDLQMPVLAEIGGGLSDGNFVVQNNTALKVLSINNLGTGQARGAVDGNVSISGNFESIYLPQLYDFTAGFHITTTYAGFNCTSFDDVSYSSTNKDYRDRYSCSAIAPGGHADTAVHAATPLATSSKSWLPKGAMAIVIIVAVIAGLAAIAFAVKCLNRRRIANRQQPPAQLQLADMGVMIPSVRPPQEHEAGGGIEELPEYSRQGKPGEVPPKYHDGEQPPPLAPPADAPTSAPAPAPAPAPPATTRSFFTSLVRLSNFVTAPASAGTSRSRSNSSSAV